MTRMLTIHGDVIDLITPITATIKLETIAAHLAGINRFNGATRRPINGQPGSYERRSYSVAEHSLLCLEIAERDMGMRDPAARLAVLLHDAHEAYIGDMTTPMKQALGSLVGGNTFAYLESCWVQAIRAHFQIVTAAKATERAIRLADLAALATEKRDLMPAHEWPWPVLDGIEPAGWVNLLDRDPHDEWDQRFFVAAEGLLAERAALHGT